MMKVAKMKRTKIKIKTSKIGNCKCANGLHFANKILIKLKKFGTRNLKIQHMMTLKMNAWINKMNKLMMRRTLLVKMSNLKTFN
jgi:hypothetical protein